MSAKRIHKNIWRSYLKLEAKEGNSIFEGRRLVFDFSVMFSDGSVSYQILKILLQENNINKVFLRIKQRKNFLSER